MDINHYLPHLAAAPVAVATVAHTYGGLGFASQPLSIAVSASLAVGVWAAWSHVFAPDSGRYVRSIGLAGAIALSGADGYLMYQYKGDIESPGYAPAMANYQTQYDRYQQEISDWTANTATVVTSIKAQQKEIMDTDKMTSRRVDMDRLTKQLDDVSKRQPPVFGLQEPVKTMTVNTEWLVKTCAVIGLTPVLYGVMHLFGWRGRKPEVLPVADDQPVIDRKSVDYADVLAIESLPIGARFDCPCCGAASIKAQSRTVTCRASTCRTTVSRLRAKHKPVITKRPKLRAVS